jgi:hypothetical protein
VADRVLVLNVLRGLNNYDHLRDDLALEELTRGASKCPDSSSTSTSGMTRSCTTDIFHLAFRLSPWCPPWAVQGWWCWWPYTWWCWWGLSEHHRSDSSSYPRPCSWRYTLAILPQPMVMVQPDVALSGSGWGPSSSAQPACDLA